MTGVDWAGMVFNGKGRELEAENAQLKAQLAEAEADRRMLLNALRAQVVTAETQRQLLKEAI
jgi:hypothetical protein